MFSATRIRRLSLVFIAALTVLACGVSGGDAEPTAPPAATSVPATATTPPQPTATLAPTSAPEATAAPTTASGEVPPIEIVMVNGYLDTFESWNIVGLVRNNTDRAIDNVEIEVELFDANEASLYKETTYIDLYSLAPGEVSPFSYVVYETLPTADHFLATVVGNGVTELSRAVPEVVNTRLTHDDSGDTHLTGEILNSTDQPIVVNSLAGATFDASGQILTANSYSVSIRYLDPGSSGPFRITIPGADTGTEAIDSFEIFVDAEVSEPIAPFGVTISDAYNYIDTFDNLHLTGEVTNDGTATLNINLIAAIYDVNGIVLDAADVTLPFSAVAPGETVPYDFDFWGPLNYAIGLVDEADSYTIQVDAYWTWDTTTELITLSTQNDVNTIDAFGGEFNGQVVNDSGGAISNVTILIYMRDLASGQVIATGYDYYFDEIAAGGTVDYTVFVDVPTDFDVNSAEYFVVVKGERP